MNHMITDDPGTSSYSPNFAGTHCIHCGKREDVNEKGECDICATGQCFLCENKVNAKSLKSVKDKLVCTECIDYNGIDMVRDLIIRFNLRAEKLKRKQAEDKLKSVLIHS